MAPERIERVESMYSQSQRMMALALAAVDGFRYMSLAADGAPLTYIEGAICWRSASSIPVFNGAGIFSARLINQATLKAVDAHFRAHGRPYSLLTLDGLVPDATGSLARLGYSEYDAMPGMWLEGLPGVHVGRSSGSVLRIFEVDASQDLALYRSLLSQVFQLPSSEVELILADKTLQVPALRHYLGSIDGEPVCTISMVLSRGVAGIWNVGTLPAYRHRGVATEMVRHALSQAQQLGYNASMLLASTEGLPLYARLGYATLSTLRVFVPGKR